MGNTQGGSLSKRDKGDQAPQQGGVFSGPAPIWKAARAVRSSSDDDPILVGSEGLQMKVGEVMGSGRSPRIVQFDEIDEYPVVIKYTGNAKNVSLAGTWDGWKKKIPMVKSSEDFTTILNLPEGRHEFRFFVDGRSIVDHSLPRTEGTGMVENNLLLVDKADFEVFDALEKDSRAAEAARKRDKSSSSRDRDSSGSESAGEGGGANKKGGGGATTGRDASTNQQTASNVEPKNFGQSTPDRRQFEKSTPPPALPPHLLQVILNKDTPITCDPNVLPEPNHVMLNHLYALSIKDDVMVLSATHRYRKKYVTTLLYKPV